MAEILQYSLLSVGGKYAGQEFPLDPDLENFIGRADDSQVVLQESMVSRKHAKITLVGEKVFIEDLGSTNGTLVNSRKIRRAHLRVGDRVLIGTSMLRLVSSDTPRDEFTLVLSKGMKPQDGRSTTGISSMSGRIDEIPLADVIQLLSSMRKSGIMEIHAPHRSGRIFLREGVMLSAQIKGSRYLSPQKALYRMVAWKEGTFKLEKLVEKELPASDTWMRNTTDGLLLEAMRQQDELERLRPMLPSSGAQFRIAQPLGISLRELSPEQLDMLEIAHNHVQLRTILDASPEDDLETSLLLVHLLEVGALEVMETNNRLPLAEVDEMTLQS